eukprot:gene3531-13598_t
MGSKDATNIDIFLRLRPAKKNDGKLIVPDYAENKVEFNVPRHLATGPNNQKEHYNFRFNSVIGPEAKQDETGSGKTFTITGGPERYVDRGIIPRSISAIFGEIAKRGDYQYQVHISYLEIYNDTGYDLLDPGREVSAMEDLRQVKVMVDDEEGGVRFHNLEKHPAATEEDALNLGGEDTVRRSKLNLVDLAGSERVSKTGVDGTTLAEAKPHIPYRNWMMTTALKDSLGGNCRTVMVATASSDPSQILESISTCRLKQEVRDLKDELRMLKGEGDERGPLTPDELLRLRDQVEAFVAEHGPEVEAFVAEHGPEVEAFVAEHGPEVEAFVAEHGPEANLNLAGSMMFIKAAFDTFKTIINEGGGVKGGPGVPAIMGSAGTPKGGEGGGSGPMSADVAEQIKKLKLQVQQRDNEINILVSMLKRREAKGGPVLSGSVTSLPGTGGGPGGPPQGGPEGGGSGGSGGGGSGGGGGDDISALFNTNMLADRNKAFELFRKSYRQNEKYDSAKTLGQSVNESKQRINDLKTLIEQRRVQRSVAGGPDGEMEDDHEELQYKAQIEQRPVAGGPDGEMEVDHEELQYKAQIEQVGGGGGGPDGEMVDDHEEQQYKAQIEQVVAGGPDGEMEDDHEELQYKAQVEQREIEHLHMMLEQSRVRLQRDFEQWLGLMSRQGAAGGGPPGGPLPGANGGGPAAKAAPPHVGKAPPVRHGERARRSMASVSSSRGGGGGGPSAGPSPSQSMASPGLMASAAAQRRMQDAFQNVDPQDAHQELDT